MTLPSTTCSFRVLSYPFRFRSSVPGAVEALERLLAPFVVGAEHDDLDGSLMGIDRVDGLFEASVDGERAQLTETLRSAVGWVAWKASLEAIDSSHGYLALHAGAVAVGREAILLPAPPDAGKTTLTAGLVRAGLGYLSDEAALIDPVTGSVHPFPRPLSMEPSSRVAVGMPSESASSVAVLEHVTVDELGGGTVADPCRVAAIVFPIYRPGAHVAIQAIGRAETVLALAENAFNLDRFGGAGVELLARVAAEAKCFRLTMGDLDEAVGLVSGIVGSR